VPLFDGSGRLIIGWSQCRIIDPDNNDNVLPCTLERLAEANVQAASPLFGYWLYDSATDTQTPLVLAKEGEYLAEIVALDDKPFPQSTEQAPQSDVEISLQSSEMAILDIRSVYDFSGQDSASPDLATLSDSSQSVRADRSAQYIRVIKAVSIPDEDVLDFNNRAFGRNRGQSMRDILGYAPIEPDGSARFRLPANMAFSLEILDAQGMRSSPRHESWLQLASGEVRECNGCHTAQSTAPHGLIDRGITSINQGASGEGVFTGSGDTIIAQVGETMAQARARVMGVSSLSPTLAYVDLWSDVSQRVADVTTQLSYDALLTAAPISDNCQSDWQKYCRISIHFPVHVQPLFELERPIFDDAGVTELAQNQCTSCHSNTDSDGIIRVPLAQLDLSSAPSLDDAFFTTAYRELLVNDNEQEIVDGILLDKLVPVLDNAGNPVFETDEDGELILDADDQPIITMTNVSVRAAMSLAGAASSPRFFDLFAVGGSHHERLNDSELRLLTEWLDLGGQYYNDPFAVPND